MAQDSRSRKVAPGLVALGSAAIVAVYATGYIRSEPTEAAVIAAATEAARQSLAQSPLVIPTLTAAATQTSSPTVTATPARTQTPGTAAAIPTATSSTSTGVQAATPTQAPASPPTPAPAPVKTATPVPTQVAVNGTYRDGSYTGSGTSRHGGIEVKVVVNGGRIVSAEISRCSTRYPCSYIEELPGDVVANQRVTARYISGATDSSHAYMQAVTAALAKAV